MDLQNLLVDTSVIIDHLRKKDKTKSQLYRVLDDQTLYISSVSLFELHCGATTLQKKQDINNILSCFKVIPFNSEIAEVAGEVFQSLRKQNKMVEIRDIFIGATALNFNLPIITLNQKHFERIVEYIFPNSD